MEIKPININRLIPNSWNPNVLDINKYTVLVNNIKKDKAMLQPILVRPKDDRYEIIDGYHRWKASKEAGLKEIDCVIITADLPEAKLRTLSFNAIRGENDEEKLKELIRSLEEDDIDIKQIERETGLFAEDFINNDSKTILNDGISKPITYSIKIVFKDEASLRSAESKIKELIKQYDAIYII